jgi:uncharacterized phiE125 gp8 family phage protein
MANRVTWIPSTEADIASYRLESAATEAGPFATLATITHNLADPSVYDTAAGVFFYEDAAGALTTWYRLIAIDSTANESQPSTPFQTVDGGAITLASLNDLKDYLSIKTTADDGILLRILLAASAWFESKVGRTLASSVYTEAQDGNGTRTIIPRHYPVTSVASVVIDGQTVPPSTSVDVSGWVHSGDVIKLRGFVAYSGTANVEVVYTAGYPVIPADITQAVIEVAADRYRSRTRVGEVSKSMGGESVSFVTFTIPASVQSVIESYRRISV